MAGIEGATRIDELDDTKPTPGEDANLSDDYHRQVKTAVQGSFPNLVGAVNADDTELNLLENCTSSTAELNILTDVTADKDELNKLDNCTATTTELNLLAGRTGTIWTSTNDGALAKDADFANIDRNFGSVGSFGQASYTWNTGLGTNDIVFGCSGMNQGTAFNVEMKNTNGMLVGMVVGSIPSSLSVSTPGTAGYINIKVLNGTGGTLNNWIGRFWARKEI